METKKEQKHKQEYLETLAKGTQICTVCKIDKPLSEYYFEKKLDKHTRRCKVCRIQYNKDNAERIRELAKVNRHKPEHIKRRREYSKKWYWEKKEQSLLAQARGNHRGLECTLKVEDIKIPVICPIFKIPFDRDRFAPSLDRFDNTKGYHKDNIWVISKLANTMKNSAKLDELKQFCKSFLEILQDDIVQTT